MPQLTTLIPSFAAPVTDRVWLVGAHGGAGCTTIRHSDPERFADAGRALPVSQDPSMPSRIILCAMGTGSGRKGSRRGSRMFHAALGCSFRVRFMHHRQPTWAVARGMASTSFTSREYAAG